MKLNIDNEQLNENVIVSGVITQILIKKFYIYHKIKYPNVGLKEVLQKFCEEVYPELLKVNENMIMKKSSPDSHLYDIHEELYYILTEKIEELEKKVIHHSKKRMGK